MIEIKHPLIPKLRWLLFAALILTCFQFVEQVLSESGTTSVFRYERDLILEGEYYRLITAHLVHLNWLHFGMNLLGLAACGLLLDGSVKGLTTSLLLGMTTISAGLFLLYPAIDWYAGYSGVLYGQLLYALLTGVADEARRARQRVQPRALLRLCLLLLGALYLLFRVIAGVWFTAGAAAASELSEVLIGAPVLHEAHLLGAIAGGFSFGLLCLRKSTQT